MRGENPEHGGSWTEAPPPQGPQEMVSVHASLPLLAVPTPGPEALGSDKGLQQGTSQEEQRLHLWKAEDQKVLTAVFYI